MTDDRTAALVFDVQGTLLDFYTPVLAATEAGLGAHGAGLDLDGFVNDWRASYFTGMKAVTEGGREWVPTATIYREGLDRLLEERGLSGRVDAEARAAMSDAWNRLVPWPDTVAGLARLRPHFVLIALTNGGLASTIAMCARHDLGFHAVLTAELVRSFKPDPSMYRLALQAAGVPPDRVTMVAAHPYDLEAAHAQGMRAAFIDRPDEFGPERPNPATAPSIAAHAVPDLQALADALGLPAGSGTP